MNKKNKNHLTIISLNQDLRELNEEIAELKAENEKHKENWESAGYTANLLNDKDKEIAELKAELNGLPIALAVPENPEEKNEINDFDGVASYPHNSLYFHIEKRFQKERGIENEKLKEEIEDLKKENEELKKENEKLKERDEKITKNQFDLMDLIQEQIDDEDDYIDCDDDGKPL